MKYKLILLMSLAFLACKTEPKTSDLDDKKTNASRASAPYPHQAFIIDVNRLRLRDAPGPQSNTIGNIPEYEVVYSRGEISKRLDTVILRGQEYISPYHKVTSSLGEGWVFGGAMTKIYEGKAKVDVPASIMKLAKDLRTAPKKNIGIGGWMANRITDEDTSNPQVNDMYLAIAMDALDDRDFLINLEMEKEIEGAGFTDDDYEKIFDREFDPSSNPFSKKAYDSGFVMHVGEGMYWPELSVSRLMEIIGGPYTESMKAYADVDQFIYEHPYMTDAAIFTDLEVIAQVIDKIAAYETTYPDNIFKERHNKMMKWMLDDIKYGTNNTPAFDYLTKLIDPKWKQDILDIIEKYKASPWISELVSFREDMDKNGWKSPIH